MGYVLGMVVAFLSLSARDIQEKDYNKLILNAVLAIGSWFTVTYLVLKPVFTVYVTIVENLIARD